MGIFYGRRHEIYHKDMLFHYNWTMVLHRKQYQLLILSLVLIFSSCSPANVSLSPENQPTVAASLLSSVTPSPVPSLTPTIIPTPTSTPLPTAIPDLHDRLLVCQPSQGIDDLALHFYWLDLSCLNREGVCQNILEPYFNFYMKYQGEKSRLNFSLDGSKLLYLQDHNLYEQTMDLYTFDVPTGISQPISFNTNIEYVQYAANAKKILYITKNAGLYLTDASGSGWQIVSDYYVSLNAAFSPDGNHIAFAGEPRVLPDSCFTDAATSDMFIYLVNLENGENTVRQLSPLRVEEGHCGQLFYAHPLAWSADSSRLVYTRQLAPEEEIVCMMDLDSQVERCFPDVAFASIGRYDLSVEDQLVLAGISQASTSRVNDLYVLDMNTGLLRQITWTPANEMNPQWVENDHLIVYESESDDIRQIGLTDGEGSWHENLTDSNSSYYLRGQCSNTP